MSALPALAGIGAGWPLGLGWIGGALSWALLGRLRAVLAQGRQPQA